MKSHPPLHPTLIVAQLRYLETIREKLLLGVLVAAALITASSFFLATISLGQDARVQQNTGLTAIHLLSLVVLVFVTTTALARDTERRTLAFLFPKQVTPLRYILGNYLGLFAFGFTIIGILTLVFSIGASFTHPASIVPALISSGYALLELSIVLAMAILFGSFTAPLNASLYTLGFWMIGHSQQGLLNYASSEGNEALTPLVSAIYYVLPNLGKYDVTNSLLYSIPITTQEVLVTLAYTALYTTLLLGLSFLVTRQREA
jgi:ABC-type transport system involved in multi-copper enzyme maturation permease subunit